VIADASSERQWGRGRCHEDGRCETFEVTTVARPVEHVDTYSRDAHRSQARTDREGVPRPAHRTIEGDLARRDEIVEKALAYVCTGSK